MPAGNLIPSFTMHFLSSNLLLMLFSAVFFLSKRILKNQVSQRIQYNLWFLFLALLTMPFIPLNTSYQGIFNGWIGKLFDFTMHSSSSPAVPSSPVTGSGALNWAEDFSVSVSNHASSLIWYAVCAVWVLGILGMLFLLIRSSLRLRALKKSALPLQNRAVRLVYRQCLRDIGCKRNIPIYSTAFLKSPVAAGLINPRIYVPIHMISDFNDSRSGKKALRYILLHELGHCRHFDSLINFLMNAACTLYWFNPIIWYAVKEMRSDREIACDTFVLNLLDENDYTDYGRTLIHFADKVPAAPFSSAAGIGGSLKQIQKRIVNIASYNGYSRHVRIKGICTYLLAAALVLGCAPALSLNAQADDIYQIPSNKTVAYEDLSAYFSGYDGTFVLYDISSDSWNIYNREAAEKRVSPDSTFKIYSGLFGLDAGSVSNSSSFIEWDHTQYPFEAWNQDQNLDSALKNSVNWYFQELDRRTGVKEISRYINEIGYGNRDLAGGLDEFWLESSLKISPVEQAELLARLFSDAWDFTEQNVQAVKNALLISDMGNIRLYGKTGTGSIEGNDINGWFIGCTEAEGSNYAFAVNIQGDKNADGKTASQIALTILRAKGIIY